MLRHPSSEASPVQLGAEQQYRRALLTFPSLSEEQEQALIVRALAGEDVRNDLILSLQRRVYNLAYRMADKYLRGKKEQAAERMDFVQKANEEMLLSFRTALRKENPSAYLLKVARFTMIDCMKEVQASQKRTRDGERNILLDDDAFDGEDMTSFIETIPVEVRLLPPRDPHTTYGALYLAIQDLPEKQRLVMMQHYGIGCAPEPLNIISRKLFPNSPRNAHYHHRRALAVLERMLGPSFPHALAVAGGAQ